MNFVSGLGLLISVTVHEQTALKLAAAAGSAWPSEPPAAIG